MNIKLAALRYSATRWSSRITVGLSIRAQWSVLIDYLKREKEVETVSSQPARKLLKMMNTATTKIQLVLLTSLKPFVKIIGAFSRPLAFEHSPFHLLTLTNIKIWKSISYKTRPREVDLEASYCHFGSFSFTSREKDTMRLTYVKCAGHAMVEFEKVLEDTTDLIEHINIFHPPYLLRMQIKDDVMRKTYKKFPRVFDGLLFNDVEEMFHRYHTEVKVSVSLPSCGC